MEPSLLDAADESFSGLEGSQPPMSRSSSRGDSVGVSFLPEVRAVPLLSVDSQDAEHQEATCPRPWVPVEREAAGSAIHRDRDAAAPSSSPSASHPSRYSQETLSQ